MSHRKYVPISAPVQIHAEHIRGQLLSNLTILVVDMGGTTFNAEVSRDDEVILTCELQMSDCKSIAGGLAETLALLPKGVKPDLAVIGSTGLPSHDRSSIDIRANLWWGPQSAAPLESEFGFKIVFFNDLEMSGAGAIVSGKQELLSGPNIEPGHVMQKTTLVINHGTGLGVGRFISTGNALQVDHSEEGHRLLPITIGDTEEVAMASFLWRRVIRRMRQWDIAVPPSPIRLEFEDALRVEDLFWALYTVGITKPKPRTMDQIRSAPSPVVVIVKLAMAEFNNPGKGDPLCLHTMHKWVEFIARFAVDAQYGGVPRLILAGENVNYNLPYLRRWFADYYLQERYPHGALSATRSVQVCTDRRTAFLGGRILAACLVSQ